MEENINFEEELETEEIEEELKDFLFFTLM